MNGYRNIWVDERIYELVDEQMDMWINDYGCVGGYMNDWI